MPGKVKANLRSIIRDKMQIASFPTPLCPEGQAGKPVYPFKPKYL
jgi:hypothetical protein